MEGCTVYHAHGGFTIGSEMSGDIRNVRVNNCTFMGTDIGLRFKSTRGRGGVVENHVYVSNVRMTDIGGGAINFSMFLRRQIAVGRNDRQCRNQPPATSPKPHRSSATSISRKRSRRGAQSAIVLEGLPVCPSGTFL